ncbi:alkaline phosphatase family protein [Demequina sp. NBRC 110053]|uniref:alkaline phosphatase family protein n=1 Tax=Demequina sp. NBRC 110053 TaxID=1570342 RepID=UPI000A031399|nr:alkaline phosphatase family protein [Demequina sp. NBRC 110053]
MDGHGRRRPWTVTALIIFTVAGGLLVLALGLLIIAAVAFAEEPVRRAADAVAVGVVFTAVGTAQVGIAVALARRRNGARVILTVVLAFSMLTTAYDSLSGRQEDDSLTLTAVALNALLLFFAWDAPTRAWFQTERDRRIGRAVASTTRSPMRRALEIAAQVAVLGLTIWATPGVSADAWYSVVLAAVAVAVVSWALQPSALFVAGRFGWGGALAMALFAQAITIGLALWLSPGITVDSVWWALVASWVFASLTAVLAWAFSVGTDDYLLVHASRMAPDPSDLPDDGHRGVVFVQLDGVPAPLLAEQMRAGNLPTISRWIRDGSHAGTEWTARVPSTTPVSQAGILHGSTDNIPAFRWWDRSLGRLLVANRPADAAVIEQRISDGRGLLADGGVAISNLFSGDAPTSHLTMSASGGAGAALGDSRSYATFFAHPAGFSRALVLTLGEMVKELVQGRRQVRRDVRPRVHRRGAYVLLRGVTNVMLRDLNTSLVVGAMATGAKSIYVDYVDYDEIAHHAGVARPESLASLAGLDAVVATIERFAASGIAAREYDIVLVSDHGQSQGATFLQRAGVSLEGFVTAHTGGRAVAVARDREGAGAPAELLVAELAGAGSRTARVAERAIARADARTDETAEPPAPVAVRRSHRPTAAAEHDLARQEPTDADDLRVRTARPDAAASTPSLAVVGSGNLGGIWFTDHDHGLSLPELESRHPGLVGALAAHAAIGFAVVRTEDGPLAIGERGTRDLHTGVITGDDPLAGYPAHTAADFARASAFPDAPDIYVNSVYNASMDEVAAFEELVGCHGGVGGWQTRPLLVYPAAWRIGRDLVDPTGRLYGADAVHRQLVRWLEELGHREGQRADAGSSGEAAPR